MLCNWVIWVILPSEESNETWEGECGLYYLNMNREVRERLKTGSDKGEYSQYRRKQKTKNSSV